MKQEKKKPNAIPEADFDRIRGTIVYYTLRRKTLKQSIETETDEEKRKRAEYELELCNRLLDVLNRLTVEKKTDVPAAELQPAE